MMPYAVNLFDLQGYSGSLPMMFLLRPVLTMEMIEVDKQRIDSVAVRLACSDDRGAAIVNVIRMHVSRNDIRIYRSKTGNGDWKRV